MAFKALTSPATFIGPAADRATQLEECAVGDFWFEDDTGRTYRKSVAGAWIEVLSDGAGLLIPYDVGGLSFVGGRQVKSAIISAANAGDNTLVAAVPTKIIRVHQFTIINNHTAVQTIAFESAASGTAITGDMILGANGGLVEPFDPTGHFQTIVSELLNLELAGATAVGGWLKYTEV